MDIQWILNGSSMDIQRSSDLLSFPSWCSSLQPDAAPGHRRARSRSQNFGSSRIDALKLAAVDSSKARGDSWNRSQLDVQRTVFGKCLYCTHICMECLSTLGSFRG